MTAKEAITLLSQLSAGIEGVLDMHYAEAIDMAIEALKAQEKTDPISRQDALDVLDEFQESVENGTPCYAKARAQMCNLPPIQPEKRTETHSCDYISRQAAIDALMEILDRPNHAEFLYTDEICKVLNELPSVQPQRTCVNCGRTANNGGWYADGSTRCPIEEHYALPKDGYCHLWEKRNVTDDDYPERREE